MPPPRRTKEEILALAQELEAKGYAFRSGRPRKGREGALQIMVRRLGLSERYIQLVLKKAKEPPPPPPDPSTIPPAERTPLEILDELERNLDRFIDATIAHEATFGGDLVLWVETGIELIHKQRKKWTKS